jgi:hypothetical protein
VPRQRESAILRLADDGDGDVVETTSPFSRERWAPGARGPSAAPCGCDEPVPPRLEHGRAISYGAFRCLSLEAGVRCVVSRTGNGFLINRDGVTRVG